MATAWQVKVESSKFERGHLCAFGQGRSSPGGLHHCTVKAALNFGDCLAYASARAAGDTLLFVGADFVHTDIVPAR